MTSSAPTAGLAPMPIAQFAADLLRHHAERGRNPSTLQATRQVLNQLAERVGIRTVADLDDDAIRRFIDHLPDGLSPNTFFSKLGVLRAVCNHAVRMGILDTPPVFPLIPQPADRGRPSGPPPRDLSLSRAGVARVLDHLKARSGEWEGHRLYALTATVVFTGLLRDEVLWLQVEDIDLAAGTIRIRRRERFYRTQRPLETHIPEALSPILAAWLPLAGPEFAFPNQSRSNAWTGGPTGAKPVQRLQAAGRAAGVEAVTFDSLRRFFLAHAAPSLDIVPAPTILPVIASRTAPPPTERGAADREASEPDDRPAIKTKANPDEARDDRRAQPFSIDDATRLMVHLLEGSATWEGHRLYVLAAVALYTGLPRGKILALAPEDCDFGERLIRVAGQAMPQPMSPELASILFEWIPRIDWTPWLVPGARFMGPWTGGRPGEKPLDQLQRAAREAGLGDVTFQDLRNLWSRYAGRLVLGEDYRGLTPPDRIADGPRPRRPGPPRRRDGCERADVPRTRPVEFGADGRPTVLGRAKRRLSKSGYRVVAGLLNAGRNGLSLPELQIVCGDARGIIRRLRGSDPDWEAAIYLDWDGKRVRRYFIGPPGPSGSNPHLQNPQN